MRYRDAAGAGALPGSGQSSPRPAAVLTPCGAKYRPATAAPSGYRRARRFSRQVVQPSTRTCFLLLRFSNMRAIRCPLRSTSPRQTGHIRGWR